ncbi:MAG TPA: tocopherol cyclase family protein [Clostridia bacterium]|nr:tocopherol cyclase family protein [Clostridia bacterium]
MNLIGMPLKPEAYQGSGQKAPYFEGWYYRVQTAGGETVALIPGICKTKNGAHAFVQLIASFLERTFYFDYPARKFVPSGGELLFCVGDNLFSNDRMELDIRREIAVRGTVEFRNPTEYSAGFWGRDIMGPFSLLPYLECRHGVVCVKSSLAGSLNISGRTMDFDGGTGYIEKDWGRFFPRSYVWMESARFAHSDASFMLSYADVPVFGKSIRGLIAFLYFRGKFYRFATYSAASVTRFFQKNGEIFLRAESPFFRIDVKAYSGQGGELAAPAEDGMAGRIRECSNGTLEVRLTDRHDRTIFQDTAANAGIEIVDPDDRLTR